MTEPAAATSPLRQFPVTWDELHRHARALAWRLLDLGPFEGVVAVARGGLVPAAIVARELDLRLVDTICVSSYDDRRLGERQRIEVLKGVSGAPEGAFRDRLCEARGTAAGRHFHHRGEPGHLDLVPLGHRSAIRPAARRSEARRLSRQLPPKRSR